MLRTNLNSTIILSLLVALTGACSERQLLGEIGRNDAGTPGNQGGGTSLGGATQVLVGGASQTGGASQVLLGGASQTGGATQVSVGGALQTGGASQTGGATQVSVGGTSQGGGTGQVIVGGATNGGSSGSPSECLVTITSGETSPTVSTYTYSYDAAAQRIVNAVYTYDLDDQLRAYKVYGNESGGPKWYWTETYDAQGNVTSNVHYTEGTRTYVNTYDGIHLVRVDASGQGSPDTIDSYQFGDTSNPDAWIDWYTGNARQTTRAVRRQFVDGRVSRVSERVIQLGDDVAMPAAEWHYYYGDGHIFRVDRDGNYFAPSNYFDGIPNVRFEWERNPDGNVTRFTQDGVDDLDDPVVNGIIDYSESYSAGCAGLLKQFPWLAHEPGPNSIGPRWRTDSF